MCLDASVSMCLCVPTLVCVWCVCSLACAALLCAQYLRHCLYALPLNGQGKREGVTPCPTLSPSTNLQLRTTLHSSTHHALSHPRTRHIRARQAVAEDQELIVKVHIKNWYNAKPLNTGTCVTGADDDACQCDKGDPTNELHLWMQRGTDASDPFHYENTVRAVVSCVLSCVSCVWRRTNGGLRALLAPGGQCTHPHPHPYPPPGHSRG